MTGDDWGDLPLFQRHSGEMAVVWRIKEGAVWSEE